MNNTETNKNEILYYLNPLHINPISALITAIGFVAFYTKWKSLRIDSVLKKTNIYHTKKYIFICFSILTILNLFFSTETPSDYETELEIQRAIEHTTVYISSFSLALVLFIVEANKHIKPKLKAFIKYPMIHVGVGFLHTLFILMYVNLPKFGVLHYYYRNIISTFMNLSLINIMTGVYIMIMYLLQ